ncbi:MAG: AbrB/MazE/SpoVT family DNA-binding domain-containing protein [Dehalococcoidia bacterium]
MVTSHIMKMSSNGQVSIPAAARSRWRADRLLVVDMGDRVVVRPLPDDPIGDLQGKYAGRGPSADEARRQARADDAAADERRR